jgi:hypothetical protein
MEHEDSLPPSHKPATGPDSEPADSSLQLHMEYSEDPF